MNIKGLSYIRKPLKGAASRTASRSPAQIMSELGSLYRQEVRLEKQLVVWRNNEMQTRRELRQVQERRALLDGVLERGAGTDLGSPSAERKSGDGGGRKASTRQDIPPSSPQPQLEPEPEVWERRQPPIALDRQRVRRSAAGR